MTRARQSQSAGGFPRGLWPNEPEAIEVLAEWFGYVVSGRLNLHKILLMVGPTRGGKGVIARILIDLGRRKIRPGRHCIASAATSDSRR